jgi:hypothetical protein
MRLGILIADGKVVLGPAPASKVESEFKAAVQSGANGVGVIELWSEDRGREKRHKFPQGAAPVPVSVADKPRKK